MTDRDLTQANTVRLAIEREIFGGQLAPGDALEEGRLDEAQHARQTSVRFEDAVRASRHRLRYAKSPSPNRSRRVRKR